MTENKLLYSTRELFNNYLSGKKYSIPAYQRGYKWETKDIIRLLDDILEFNQNEDLNLLYCLQNITLTETNEGYNVVDGQQRLTTLAIILSYLGEYNIINNKIAYKVRLQTAEFLRDYIYKSSDIDNYKDWDQFLFSKKGEGLDFDYQDIYYIFNAYKTVSEWFSNHTYQKEEMKNKILDNVKLIVNLPKNVEEQELFENLNGKRVPLDGADLIRALIITRVAKREVGVVDDSVKQNVLMNERRIRIGLTLDAINLWWSDDNRKIYFRNFSKEAKINGENNIKFDENIYPINYLYKLYILINNDVLSMDFFERKSIEEGFLDSLLNLQRTIENWYNDKELYHLILFTAIYATNRLSFNELYNEWKKCSKREFVKFLKTKIAITQTYKELIEQKDYTLEKHKEVAFTENWYEENELVSVSVLLDIISNLNLHLDVKLPAYHFKAYNEDLEHIFPQTPIGDKIKDNDKQTQILLQYIEIINNLSTNNKIEIDKKEIDWNNQEWKENIKKRINSKLSTIIPINSLGNMCLLHQSVNRGFGNDFFLEKRIDIMKKSQDGIFIRPHVYEAFNKVFINRQNDNIDMNMMLRWDYNDIIKRRQYIITQITQFLIGDEK